MKQEIEQVNVPYTVHESDLARSDRKNKRLWITLNSVLAVAGIILIIEIIRGSTNETSKRTNN